MRIITHATGSSGNAYTIEDQGKMILIECGMRFKALLKACKFKLNAYDFCLLSHEHKDHCRAVKDLMKIGFNIAMSIGTAQALSINPAFIYVLEAGITWHRGGWGVLPFSTVHDSIEPLGFFIKTPSGKRLIFATDTAYIKYNFHMVTHWMIECNYQDDLLSKNKALPNTVKDRIRESHFELENLISFLKAHDLSNTEEIRLIHLSEENSDMDQIRSKFESQLLPPVVFG